MSGLWDRPAGRDLPFQCCQSGVEAPQLVDPRSDRRALAREERRQLGPREVAAIRGALVGQPARILRIKPQIPQPRERADPFEVALGVRAIAVGLTARPAEHPATLVEPDRGRGHARAAGELTDAHAGRLDLVIAPRSSAFGAWRPRQDSNLRPPA